MLFGISWHRDHNETDIRALRMTKETQCATKHILKIWPVLKQTNKQNTEEKKQEKICIMIQDSKVQVEPAKCQGDPRGGVMI